MPNRKVYFDENIEHQPIIIVPEKGTLHPAETRTPTPGDRIAIIDKHVILEQTLRELAITEAEEMVKSGQASPKEVEAFYSIDIDHSQITKPSLTRCSSIEEAAKIILSVMELYMALSRKTVLTPAQKRMYYECCLF